MTLSEWINNIRWKYFTNNKSGLIFKETTKEFRIVHKMTENKRYNIKPSKIIEDGFCIQDDEREHSFPTVDDKSHLIMYEKALNEQDERIKQLQIDIIGQSEEIEILSDENKRLKQGKYVYGIRGGSNDRK